MFWYVQVSFGATDITFKFPFEMALGASAALDLALSQLKSDDYTSSVAWRE